jgi:hypothetical protein
VREALLGPEQRQDLRGGIEFDAEASRVVFRDGRAQVGQAHVGGVAGRIVALDLLREPSPDARIGREVGVTNPERDHVDAGGALLSDHAIHAGHDVLGDRVHAVGEAHAQTR